MRDSQRRRSGVGNRKALRLGLAVHNAVGCTPVPLTGIVSGDPDELLVTVRVPETAPAALGANVTVNVTCPDGLTVAGVVTPLTENPVPVIETAEIDAAAVPVFVTTTCFAEPLFVATFPKLNAV